MKSLICGVVWWPKLDEIDFLVFLFSKSSTTGQTSFFHSLELACPPMVKTIHIDYLGPFLGHQKM